MIKDTYIDDVWNERSTHERRANCFRLVMFKRKVKAYRLSSAGLPLPYDLFDYDDIKAQASQMFVYNKLTKCNDIMNKALNRAFGV